MVRSENNHQREFRKIMALRKHLGSDQNVDFIIMNLFPHASERTATPRTVAVHP